VQARRARLDGYSSVFLTVDGRLSGALLLADQIRPDTPRALRALHRAGIRRMVRLSGDRQDVAGGDAVRVSADDLDYEAGTFSVKGSPDKEMTVKGAAWAAWGAPPVPACPGTRRGG